MGFKEGASKFLAGLGLVAAAESGAMAKTPEAAHIDKTHDTTPHAEVIKSPERVLFAAAKWASGEAVRQIDGGGIEKGFDARKQIIDGPAKDAWVWFEDISGAAGKFGELVAHVKLDDGTEETFILKSEGDDFTVVSRVGDVDDFESNLALNK